MNGENNDGTTTDDNNDDDSSRGRGTKIILCYTVRDTFYKI